MTDSVDCPEPDITLPMLVAGVQERQYNVTRDVKESEAEPRLRRLATYKAWMALLEGLAS